MQSSDGGLFARMPSWAVARINRIKVKEEGED